MDIGKVEEVEPEVTVKPITLPAISLALKKAWKSNQANLEKAGIFNYLCWIQGAVRAAHVAKVVPFIRTYSMLTECARVEGKLIDCSVRMVGIRLKLPMDGLSLETMLGLTKPQIEEIFEGEIPRTPKGCSLEKAKSHWKPWLRFVNDYLVFRPQKDYMTQKIVAAVVSTWEGNRVNWAQIVQHKMRAELATRLVGEPKTVELFSAFYITTLCEELPSPAHTYGPSSSRQTPSPLSSPEKTNELEEENQRLFT